MNCKPNELAMVVRNVLNATCDDNMIGVPIKVTSSFDSVVGPAWLHSGPMVKCPNCGQPVFAFLDANLQPLRPPPSAAETVREIIEAVSA
jgi:hypothetical protein